MKKTLLLTLLSCALVLCPASAFADGQETGVIEVSVTDASGSPLPGATVTITGPRGDQTQITDETGSFRLALLPPGDYSATATLEGMEGSKKSGRLSAGGKLEFNLRMSMGTSETITVTSEAPMVDKFNVSAGATVTAEIGEQAAGSTRTYYGVVNMLPGVTNDADNQDIQQMRPSVNGAHFADNAVFVDGVDTTFTRLGGSRIILPTTATSEVTLEGGGAGAEYGRVVGSSTNVIVKSGTNRFHGDLLFQYQDMDWNAEYDEHIELEQRVNGPRPRDFFLRTPEELDGTDESFEATLGGPIKRDKAWFFVGYSSINTFNLDKALDGDLIDTSIDVESRIAKFNFQPAPKHSLSVSYIETPLERIYFHPGGGDIYSPTLHDLSGDLENLSWNWSINENVFSEFKVATQTSNEDKFLNVGNGTDVASALAVKQQDPRFPPNPALGIHYPGNNYNLYTDDLDAGSWHNGWLLDNGFGTNEYPRDQANLAMTFFAGDNHEIKVGLDWQEVEWISDVQRVDAYSGELFNPLFPQGYAGEYVDDGTLTGIPGVVINGLGCGFFEQNICGYRDYNPPDRVAENGRNGAAITTASENTALFVRDRFTAGDHWTFNLGFRLEDTKNTNDVGRTVIDDTVFSPRLSASYDVKGDGRMLFSANAGRYYAQVNQQFVNEWLTDGWNGYSSYNDNLFCSETDVFLGASGLAPSLAFCGFFGPGFSVPFAAVREGIMWQYADAGLFNVDIEPYYKDEIILGFEWQFARNWAVDAKYIYWELDNIISNTLQRGPDGQFFYLSANSKNYPEILSAIGWVDQGIIDQYEEAKKLYKGLQLQLNRRFANGWAWYNNLTLSELWTTGAGAWWNNTNDSYGMDLGTTLTPDGIAQCALNQANRAVPIDCQAALGPHVGESASTINRYGRNGINVATVGGSGVDRPFIFKSFGFKNFNLGKHIVTIGGSLNWQDGVAWGRTESVPASADVSGNAVITNVSVLAEENGTRRLDDIYELNLSTAWNFPVGLNDTRGEFRVEVTNLTDEQAQMGITGLGEVQTARRYFQRPRQVRATIGFKF